MKSRLSLMLTQLAIAVAAVFGARVISEVIWLAPEGLRKQSPLSFDELATISGIMLVSHAVVLLGMALANRRRPFSDLRRFLAEIYAVMVATSLGSCAVFLLTTVPFSANYFAWVFVLIAGGYLVLFLGAAIGGVLKMARAGRSVFGLIFSPWTVVAGLLVFSPAALAVFYKANEDFSNAVNTLRAEVHAPETRWQLVPAYPGHEFEQPMFMAFEPGVENSVLVLSRTGRLRRHVTGPEWRSEVLIDFSAEVASIDKEMGAYSFALHPEYGQAGSPRAGFVYVHHTHAGPEGDANRIVRYDLSAGTQAEREATRTLLVEIPHPPTRAHIGGGLMFGPDGMLYFTVGDFVTEKLTQQIDKRLVSGVFRIDVDMQGGTISTPIRNKPVEGITQNYYIPTDNPWYGEPDALEEFWALGLRNPWRLSFDAATGTIWVGEVGRNRFEEQNRLLPGDNAQWSYREGPAETPFHHPEKIIGTERPPLYYYAQTALQRATLGGFIYHGRAYPRLDGMYIFADNQASILQAFDPDDPFETVHPLAQGTQYGQLGMTGIFVDDRGEIFVTLLGGKTHDNGSILVLRRADDVEPPPAQPAGDLVASVGEKYVAVCGRCHGEDGRGGGEVDLDVARPDFASADWQASVTDDYIHKIIVEGGAAVGKSDLMPAWEGFFSEAELDVLIRRIRDFGPES